MEHHKKELFGELKEVYDMLTDTGYMTMNKLSGLMEALGHPVSEIEVTEMINAVDEVAQFQWHDNGQIPIDFHGFCRVMLKAEREEQLRKFFKLFDKDDDGFLNSDELRRALVRILDEEIDLTIIKEMMDEADNDGDGRLSFDELLNMYCKYTKG